VPHFVLITELGTYSLRGHWAAPGGGWDSRRKTNLPVRKVNDPGPARINLREKNEVIDIKTCGHLGQLAGI
jgi:hypothetical protein